MLPNILKLNILFKIWLTSQFKCESDVSVSDGLFKAIACDDRMMMMMKRPSEDHPSLMGH